MNINSVNIHYVAIQSHDSAEDKAVWTVIGHCFYEKDARDIVKSFNGGDSGSLYWVNECVVEYVRKQGAVINGLEPVEEVKDFACGINTDAFYLVHRENKNGKSNYRIIMKFTDTTFANLFCYDNAEVLGSNFFVLYGAQLKATFAEEAVQEPTEEVAKETRIVNPIFHMTVANMLATITNVDANDIVIILKTDKDGTYELGRMTADAIMKSGLKDYHVVSFMLGHRKHRIWIA